MRIVKWDGASHWDELEELCKLIDHPEGIESVFAAKVAVLYTKVKAAIFLLLSDDGNKLYGYFTCKDYGNNTAFVNDFVIFPRYSILGGRLARAVLQFILTLGFDEIKCQVRDDNEKAKRLWSWLGFKVVSHNLSMKKDY